MQGLHGGGLRGLNFPCQNYENFEGLCQRRNETGATGANASVEIHSRSLSTKSHVTNQQDKATRTFFYTSVISIFLFKVEILIFKSIIL